MADYFFDGMPNVNERLNLLYTAFAAGPYNALPLTGGALTGPVTTTSTIAATRTGVTGIIVQLLLTTNAGGSGVAGTAIHFGYPGSTTYGSRIVGAGDPTMSLAGYTAFETGGSSGFVEKMRIAGRGSVLIGTTTDNGIHLLQVAGSGTFSPAGSQGSLLLQAGLAGAQPSMVLYAGNGDGFLQPSSVMYVGKNSITNRGFTTPGTVNTMGNDYAEYVRKCLGCRAIAKGQIVGITADNTITDQWADAVMFAVKSTAPSFVGGDTWASDVGQRPSPQAGPAPTQPLRREDVITQQPVPGTNPPEYEDVVTEPGGTDDEWAEKQTAYTAALAVHNIAVQQDAEAMATFDAALEVERQKVDRIAIAGRVPVNVQGAQPGDYIVPVQDGDDIKGIAVHEDDLSMKQYLRAVGRVISIEPDGRAYVMVKVV